MLKEFLFASSMIIAMTVAAASAQAQSVSPVPYTPNKVVSFYVGGHPDDVELFMGKSIIDDMKANPTGKKVFVITTAGDGGLGFEGGSSSSYWAARAAGHVDAVTFMFSFASRAATDPVTTYVSQNGYTLARTVISNDIVMYNFLLPDSSIQGLYTTPLAKVTALDNLRTFSKISMTATLQAIIRSEAPIATKIWLNLMDPNSANNPGDHPDHMYSSKFFLDATATVDFACVGNTFYKTYVMSQLAENLSTTDKYAHAGTFAAVQTGMLKHTRGMSWEADHLAWLGKHYITGSNQPKGVCTF